MQQINFKQKLLDREAYENAKQHLEYVIAHGNQLVIVFKAKEQLEAIQQ